MTPPSPSPDPRALERPRLSQFIGPRYWPTWVLIGWMRITAALPWRVAILIHRLIGRALWHLLRRRRHIVLRNLEICFPDLTPRAAKALGRRSFENFTASAAEVAIAWFARTLPPVRVEGREHLDGALAEGRGVILYSGHFTPLEITAQFVKPLTPRFAFMFRARSNPLLDAVQARGRQRTADVSFHNTEIRAMVRGLRENLVVWYAPDQAFTGNGAELLPFFGEPAMTNTATPRLARLSGAKVLPFRFERCADGSGYLVSFDAPLKDFPTDDAIADTKRLTAILEDAIRARPDQYYWTHRRFRNRGPGLPDAYARPPRTAPPPTGRTLELGAPTLIAAVALFIVAADNNPLWRTTLAATVNDEHRWAILWCVFALAFFTLTTLLALALGRALLRTWCALILVVAAVCGYFMSEYGTIIDQSMIRNTVETTALEAAPLLSAALFWHVLLYGAIPAIVVLAVPLQRPRWHSDLLARLVTIGASMVTIVATLYVNYAAVSFFGHQNHTLRLLFNPGYPLYAAATFGLTNDHVDPAERKPLDVHLAPTANGRRPALFVFVLGETARADRFSLNGYERDTNRYTRAHDVINFPTVSSCGTSTAESVPCIFSGLGQANFTHAAAAERESVYGLLRRLGTTVFWRDNSTGCKDVCNDSDFEQRANWRHPTLCDATGCFDEVLLEDFDALLADATRDHFVVLHQRGSHGPAYHTDVPAWAKEFQPECGLPNLRNCDVAQMNNSYDNTILYTDYFLARVIEELEKRSDAYDTAMLYVSDHGESLGENGLYLHGLPYSMAPREQTEVPMLFWASTGFYAARAQAEPECLRRTAAEPTSHDAVFHSLLPLFGIASPLYDSTLDWFATCRRNRGPA